MAPPNRTRSARPPNLAEQQRADSADALFPAADPCSGVTTRWFDRSTALLVQIGYAAISALTGEPLPMALMNTYQARSRKPFDGTFVLTEAQVNRLIANSEALSDATKQLKQLVRHALSKSLDGQKATGVEAKMSQWAFEIVQRLRRRSELSRAVVFEDITSADFAPIVKGVRTKGLAVQLPYKLDLPAFVSFGSLRVHFAGRLTFAPAPSGGPESLSFDTSPVITDTFDFHLAQQDPGTGWVDHALARLQCAGRTKPFQIEGSGSPFRLVMARARGE